MLSSQKRIFAGKANLQSEPFCPYVTTRSGHLSLERNRTPNRKNASRQPRSGTIS